MKRLLLLALLAVAGCGGRMQFESDSATTGTDWSWLKSAESFYGRPSIEPYRFLCDGTEGACVNIQLHFDNEQAPHGCVFVKLEMTEEFAKHWKFGSPHGDSIGQDGGRELTSWADIMETPDDLTMWVNTFNAKTDRLYLLKVPLYPVKGNEQSAEDAIAAMNELSPVWPIEPTIASKEGLEMFIPRVQAKAKTPDGKAERE